MDALRTFDLPPEAFGLACVPCWEMGEVELAQFLNDAEEGVCAECFAWSLRVRQALVMASYQAGGPRA